MKFKRNMKTSTVYTIISTEKMRTENPSEKRLYRVHLMLVTMFKLDLVLRWVNTNWLTRLTDNWDKKCNKHLTNKSKTWKICFHKWWTKHTTLENDNFNLYSSFYHLIELFKSNNRPISLGKILEKIVHAYYVKGTYFNI